jgi:hypothetical protein
VFWVSYEKLRQISGISSFWQRWLSFHTRGIQIEEIVICKPLVCGYSLQCPCSFTSNLSLNYVSHKVQHTPLINSTFCHVLPFGC